jgi:cation transport ATPase
MKTNAELEKPVENLKDSDSLDFLLGETHEQMRHMENKDNEVQTKSSEMNKSKPIQGEKKQKEYHITIRRKNVIDFFVGFFILFVVVLGLYFYCFQPAYWLIMEMVMADIALVIVVFVVLPIAGIVILVSILDSGTHRKADSEAPSWVAQHLKEMKKINDMDPIERTIYLSTGKYNYGQLTEKERKRIEGY